MSEQHSRKRDLAMDVEYEEEQDNDNNEDEENEGEIPYAGLKYIPQTKRQKYFESEEEEEEEDDGGKVKPARRHRENNIYKQENDEDKEEEEEEEENMLMGNEEKDEEETYAQDDDEMEIKHIKPRKAKRRKIPMTIIVLCDAPTGAIGIGDADFPWKQVPPQAKQFVSRKCKERKDKTKRNAVIVGYTVFTEVMIKKEYPNCLTGVLSRSFSLYGRDLNWVVTAPTISELYHQICAFDDIEHIYVLGGARTFREAMKKYCTDMYIMFYRPSNPKNILKDYDHRIVFKDRYEEQNVEERQDLAEDLKLVHYVRKAEQPEEHDEEDL